jgi:hypothetical protein
MSDVEEDAAEGHAQDSAEGAMDIDPQDYSLDMGDAGELGYGTIVVGL